MISIKALVLAGGYPQTSLIQKLKKMGYYVILADWNEHPVAEQYADKFYQESTLNVEAIENIAKKEKVDLVMTVCTDQALNTVSLVSERLGLPCYISSETGRNVTNKKYMKSVFTANGIPTSKYYTTDRVKISDSLKYPLVVKPVDCNSSKGVVLVNSEFELKHAISEAISFSRTNEAIVEEYFDGAELSVDVIVKNGIAAVLGVTELQKIDNSFVITRSVMPAPSMNAAIENRIKEIAQRISYAFHLENCPMLIQLLANDKEISVIEFSARTGGGEKYKSIESFSGVDIIQETINLTLGINSEINARQSSIKMINDFLYCRDGVVDKLVGFDEAQKSGLISRYEQYKKEGTAVNGAKSSNDRIASFTVISESYEELLRKHKSAYDSIAILDPSGKDLIIRTILPKWSRVE